MRKVNVLEFVSLDGAFRSSSQPNTFVAQRKGGSRDATQSWSALGTHDERPSQIHGTR